MRTGQPLPSRCRSRQRKGAASGASLRCAHGNARHGATVQGANGWQSSDRCVITASEPQGVWQPHGHKEAACPCRGGGWLVGRGGRGCWRWRSLCVRLLDGDTRHAVGVARQVLPGLDYPYAAIAVLIPRGGVSRRLPSVVARQPWPYDTTGSSGQRHSSSSARRCTTQPASAGVTTEPSADRPA